MRRSWMVIGLAGILAAASLSGCGVQNDNTQEQTASATATLPPDAEIPFSDMLDGNGDFESESAKQQLSEKYDVYIQSYLSEINEGVHEDMQELSDEIGNLQDAEDVREWCEDFRELYEKLQRWQREIEIAEMIAPESMAEQHKTLVYGMYTLCKVCEYVEPSVTEAENGNAQSLKDNANTFQEGYKAALTIYEHAAAAYES